MANTPSTRLLSGLSNAKTRTFVILFGAIIIVGVGIALMRGKREGSDLLSKQGSQAVGVPSEIKTTPGGAVSEEYRLLLEKENEKRAQEALTKKTSAIPTIIGAVSETGIDKNRINLATENALKSQQTSNQTRSQFGQADESTFLGTSGPFAKTALEREREQQESRIREQREHVAKMKEAKEQSKLRQAEEDKQRRQTEIEQKAYQDSVKLVSQQMKGYAKDMHGEWSKFPVQNYVQGELATKDKQCRKGADLSSSGSSKKSAQASKNNRSTASRIRENEPGISKKKAHEIIKAGTILFGVLDTAVNSDEPGPVLATIVSGKFQGTKLLGALKHDTWQETVTLTFNQMAIPKKSASLSVQVVAIDPDTARTALASDVDHHYLLRYGTLFASSLMSGYAKGIQQSGATTTTSPLTGATTTTNPPLDNKDLLFSAFGEFGTQLGNATKQYFNTPYTVTVDQGTGVGLLFLSDATIDDDTR